MVICWRVLHVTRVYKYWTSRRAKTFTEETLQTRVNFHFFFIKPYPISSQNMLNLSVSFEKESKSKITRGESSHKKKQFERIITDYNE